MTARIEVSGLTMTFGDVRALDGVSLSLAGGKIYGLLGRNGSGKTTLLSVVAGFRKPASGEVRIGGQPVFENPSVVRDVALIREGGDTVEESEKVGEALRCAAYLRPNWDNDYAEKLMDRFEVSTRTKLDRLSRGKRSAVGIALGMAARAPPTMFDETRLRLDAPSRDVFFDAILRDYMAHPRTFVLATHPIEEVSKVLEEVVVIDRGRLVLHDTTDALSAQGQAVIGPEEAVDRFVAGRTVIGQRHLGRTKSAMLFGRMTDAERADARRSGLDLEPLPLRDLFVHLTEPKGAG